MERVGSDIAEQKSELQRILEQLPSGAQKLHLIAQLLTTQQVSHEAAVQQPSDDTNPLYAGLMQQPWPAAAAAAIEQDTAAADPASQEPGPERAVAALLQRISAMHAQQHPQQLEQEQQPEVQALLESLTAPRTARQQQQTQQQEDVAAQARQATGSLGVPVKQQQQQYPTSKLRMKPGKHLAAAAAREARQSGAAAASIAQWRRKPLNLSAAKTTGPGLPRAGTAVMSPGREALVRAASTFSQQQQQQQQHSAAAAEAHWLDPATAAAAYVPDRLSPAGQPAVQPSDSSLSGSQNPPAYPTGVPNSRRLSSDGPQISPAAYHQQEPQQPDVQQTPQQPGQMNEQMALYEGSDLGALPPAVMTSCANERGVTGLELLVDAAAAVLAPEAPALGQQQQRMQQLQQRLAAVRAQYLRQRQQQSAAVSLSGLQQQQQQQQGGLSSLSGGPEGRQRLRNLEANLTTLMSELQSLLPQIQRARAPVPRFDAASGSSLGRAYTPPLSAAGASLAHLQQQQQYAAVPAYSSNSGLLSAAAAAAEPSPPPTALQQQQQQSNETWQGIYQPELWLPAPVNPSANTLLGGSGGLAQVPALGHWGQGLTPSNTPAGVGDSVTSQGRHSLTSSSKASQNAQQLQHMLEQVRRLPGLPGVASEAMNEPPLDYAQQILSQPSPLNMAVFRKVLADILATYKEAKELLQAAVSLGLLPASKQQQQQQEQPVLPAAASQAAAAAAAAAEGHDEPLDAAAADSLDQEPPAKRLRSDQSTGPAVVPGVASHDGGAGTADDTAAADDDDVEDAEVAAAAGLSALGAATAVEGRRTPSITDVAVVDDKQRMRPGEAADNKRPGKLGQEMKRPVKGLEQQAPVQQGLVGPQPTGSAVAVTTEGGAAADALADLVHRIALVLFKMQRHVRGLAFMAVPCAAETLSVRQTAAALIKQITPDLQAQGSAAGLTQAGVNNSLDVLRPAITELQQQLAVERASAAAYQQEVEQLQQQLAATAQQQRQQARLVASAVTQLMGAVNSTAALTDTDRMTLVTAGAELLQSML